MPAYRFIKITQSISTKRISASILGPKTKESVDDYILLTQLQPESLLDVFEYSSFLKIVEDSVLFGQLLRMHGEWVSWRKRRNDSVERLLGVWPLLRHVDSWNR